MSGQRPLEGVRVVSLEHYIAGPYCTQLLVDGGAEVIKVERPDGGDPRRSYDPQWTRGDETVSGGFLSYNRGKKSVTADLSDPDDHAALDGLIDTADVLVSNFRPGMLAAHGLDPLEIQRKRRRLVACEISGFGREGPYADWPAFDTVIQAMSGLASLLGQSEEGPPGLAPMGTSDLLAGTFAALGILMALVGRGTSGEGTHLDVAMYDVTAAFLERPLTLYETTSQVPRRGEDRFSPVGAFRTGDGGWVALVIPTDAHWRRCCRAIGREDLVEDPELDTVLKRSAAMQDRVIPVLEAWGASLDQHEAAARLRDAGQPAGTVQAIDEVRSCPQLDVRGLFAPVADPVTDRPGTGPLRLPRLPLNPSTWRVTSGRSPRLGEHNAELFGWRSG